MNDTPEPRTHTIIVGGRPCAVNEHEWLAANLEPGTRVRCTTKARHGLRHYPAETFVALFVTSYFYDGVIANVLDLSDIDKPIPRGLFLGIGDTIELDLP